MEYKNIVISQHGKIKILEDEKQKLVLKVESFEKEIEISKNNEDNGIEIDNPSEEEQQSDSDSS